MNEQATPGPWVWNGKDMPFADVADARGNVIAGMCESVRHDAQQARAEERANARLIAAAPDLLAALKEVYELCGEVLKRQPNAGEYAHNMAVGLRGKVSTAIKRAEGEG